MKKLHSNRIVHFFITTRGFFRSVWPHKRGVKERCANSMSFSAAQPFLINLDDDKALVRGLLLLRQALVEKEEVKRNPLCFERGVVLQFVKNISFSFLTWEAPLL